MPVPAGTTHNVEGGFVWGLEVGIWKGKGAVAVFIMSVRTTETPQWHIPQWIPVQLNELVIDS